MEHLSNISDAINKQWTTVHQSCGRIVGYDSISGRYQIRYRSHGAPGQTTIQVVLADTFGCAVDRILAAGTSFSVVKGAVEAQLEQWHLLDIAFGQLLSQLAAIGWNLGSIRDLRDSQLTSDDLPGDRALQVLRTALLGDDPAFLGAVNWSAEASAVEVISRSTVNKRRARRWVSDAALTGRLHQLASVAA